MSQLGEVALPSLLERLQDDTSDWELQWFVAQILGQISGPGVVQGLLEVLLHSHEPELTAAAAAALGNCGAAGVAALEPLLAMAPLGRSRTIADQRSLAVQILARMGHPATVEPLLWVAQDPDAEVRTMVIEALAQFRDERILPVLLAALGDRVDSVRREAVTALGLRTDLLGQVDLVAHVQPALWDRALSVRQAAVVALGRFGTETAMAPLGQSLIIETLARALSSPQTPEPLQISIVRSLGWLTSESALTALTAAWEKVASPVQLEIISALGHLGDGPLGQQTQTVLQTWLTALIDQPTAAAQKQAIALALGRLQAQSAIPLLQTLLADPQEAVQIHSAAALRMLG